MTGRRQGAGAAVPEVPQVRRHRAIGIRGRRPVEGHVLLVDSEAEVGCRGLVGECRDRVRHGGLAAVVVGHRQRDLEGTHAGVGVARVGEGARAAVTEVPQVRRHRPVGIARRTGEAHRLLRHHGGERRRGQLVGDRGHVLSGRVRAALIVGHGERDRVGSRRSVAVRGLGEGAGAPVTEVPQVRRHGAVGIRGARPVEVHRQLVHRVGEARGRVHVRQVSAALGQVVEDLALGQGPGVHGDLVEAAGEVVGGVAAPGVVATEPPVAGVVLGGGLRVRTHQDAVYPQLHARSRVLLGDQVVPGAVVVGLGRVDDVLHPGVDAVAQPAVVEHVDVPVVAARGAGPRTAEPDQLATPGGRGLEPQLLGVDRRVREGVDGRRRARAGAAEGRGRVARHVHRARPAQGDPGAVGAEELVGRGVVHRGAAGLREPPVQVGAGGVDTGAVGVRRRSHARQRPSAVDVVRADLGGRQRGRVDRDVIDGAVEVQARRNAGPAVEGVTADPPVADVGLSVGGVSPRADLLPVYVEHHARRAQRRHDVVPLAVVVRLARNDRAGTSRVHAEDQLACVGHVDVAVVAAAVAGVGVAETEDLPPPGGRGVDPRLRREGVRPLLGRVAHGKAVGGAVEQRRRVGVADDGPGLRTGDTGTCRCVGETGPVVDGRGRVLTEAPVGGRTVADHRLRVARQRSGRAYRHVDGVRSRLVAPGVGGEHAVPVGLSGHQPCVHVPHGWSAPFRRSLGDRVDRTRRDAVPDHGVGEVLVVAVPVRRPADPHLATDKGGKGRVELGAGHLRPDLVRGDGPDRVAHQALLGGAAARGARELAADHHVVAVAAHGPARLALSGVGSAGQVRQPLLQVRGGSAHPVEVAVRIRLEGAGHGLGERVRPVIRPLRRRLRESVLQVAAVMRVADRVDHVTQRVAAVGVTVAVLHPDDRARGPVDPGRALQVSTRTEHVTGRVEAVAVGGEGENGRIGAAVADEAVGRHCQRRTGRGVDESQAVAGIARAVHRGEGAAHGELGPVRRERQRVDVAAVEGRCPAQQRAVGRLHCGDLGSGNAADAAEHATQVHGGGCGDDRLHRRVGLRLERPDQVARGRVERGDPVPDRAVHLGEAAPDVDPRVVRRRRDGQHVTVGGRRPGGAEHAGGEVVGEQVRPGHRVGSRGRTRGPGRGEAASDVHGVADHQLRPGDAVDLGRGQRVGRHRDRCRRIRFVQRLGVRPGDRRELREGRDQSSRSDRNDGSTQPRRPECHLSSPRMNPRPPASGNGPGVPGTATDGRNRCVVNSVRLSPPCSRPPRLTQTNAAYPLGSRQLFKNISPAQRSPDVVSSGVSRRVAGSPVPERPPRWRAPGRDPEQRCWRRSQHHRGHHCP